MTKRHFQAIAAMFAGARCMVEKDTLQPLTGEDMRIYLAKSISTVLATVSDRYDEARFLAACEVPE